MRIRDLLLIFAVLAAAQGAALADTFDDATSALKRGDYAGAERILLPLAQSGDLPAQMFLARLNDSWRYWPRRYAEAAKWYRRAAEQGSFAAQERLADMYLRRQGLPFSPEEAARWYRRAAEQGSSPHSQYELSRMYAEGWGVPKDYVAAYMWLSVAMSNGYNSGRGGRWRSSGGRGELGTLARSMTAAQVAEAKKLASEWKPKPER
jgi:uncharacterized protein